MEDVVPEIPESQRSAIESFVAARRALSARDPQPDWFWLWKDTVDASTFVDGSIPGDYACPPIGTMRSILPFFDVGSRVESPERRARVPVKSVVGSSWRWHEGSLPSGARGSVVSAIEFFTDAECAEAGGRGANVCLVNPLGIFYVSGEGKNRVAFLARHGVELMPCLLSERSYPTAERLELVAVREGLLSCWLCVLDSNLAVPIPYPEFTLPILEAYGVRRSKWRTEWPMLATVMNSFRMQRGEDLEVVRHSTSEPIHFGLLKAREEAARLTPLSVRLPLYSHRRLDRKPNYVRNVFIVFAALFVGFWVFERSQAMLGLGGLLGVMAMLAVPIGVRADERTDAEVALLAADACSNIERGLDEAQRSLRAES